MNGENIDIPDPCSFYGIISHFSAKQQNQIFRNFRNSTFCGKFHKLKVTYMQHNALRR